MATDWTLSYQDLTEKAAESYASLLTHSQELVSKIQRGEIAPTSLPDEVRRFSEDQGSEFYRELTALTSDFLKGLSELQSKSTEDYIQGLVGELPEPQSPSGTSSAAVPPPPPANANEWAQWYQAVTAYMAQQNQRALARYRQLLEKVARGELTPATIQDYSAKFIQSRGPLYSRDAAQLNLHFFEGLLQLNRRFTDNLFHRLSHNGHARPDGPIESVYVDLVGPAASTVSSSLLVENTRAEASDVFCKLSEFRRADGAGQTFRAPLEIEPSQFRLHPGETRSLSLRLKLDPEVFEPGRTYAGTLLINQDEQNILVNLAARTTSDSPAQQTSSAALEKNPP